MSLYFSRLTLNRYAPTRALVKLLEPECDNARADANHRLIWSLFGDAADRSRDFLWRAEGQGRFLILSARPPVASDLFCPPETKAYNPNLAVGDRLAFVLRANATKDQAAVSRMDKSARRGKSRRVDLVMDLLRQVPKGARAEVRMELAQKAGAAWLLRQGAAKGFQPISTYTTDYRVLQLGRSRNRGMTHGVLDLEGEIEVTDPAAFATALAQGFGRAKAWGCGMMLIRRAR